MRYETRFILLDLMTLAAIVLSVIALLANCAR